MHVKIYLTMSFEDKGRVQGSTWLQGQVLMGRMDGAEEEKELSVTGDEQHVKT